MGSCNTIFTKHAAAHSMLSHIPGCMSDMSDMPDKKCSYTKIFFIHILVVSSNTISIKHTAEQTLDVVT